MGERQIQHKQSFNDWKKQMSKQINEELIIKAMGIVKVNMKIKIDPI